MDVVKHLSDTYGRLTHTIRYSTQPKIINENVATHSFFVAYIAMVLCDLFHKPVNKEKVLSMALIHDVEESLTSDIIYTIKHYNQDFSEAVERLNYGIIHEIYADNQTYLDLWQEYKEGITQEAKIVEVADRISSLLYIINEIGLGNRTLEGIFDKTVQIINQQNVKEVIPIIKELAALKESILQC